MNPSPFTFKRCILLCLPALIVGAILRISLLAAIPEANYATDGNSWVSTTVHLWEKGKVRFEKKRRWLYHILLIPVPLVPGNLPQVVAVAQHILGMGVIVGVGWVTGQVTRNRGLTVPLTTIIAAIWPSMLYSEHDVSAEALVPALFIFTVASALPLEKVRERGQLLIFLILAGLLVSSQPRAKLLWAGMMIFMFFYLGWRYRWHRSHLVTIAISLVTMLTMGEKEQGSWLLLSSSLPLVKENGTTWPDYRNALRPVIEEARSQGANYPWEQKHWKKALGGNESEAFSKEWLRLREDPRFAKAGKDLAMEGIFAHPFTFAGFVLMKNAIAASGPAALYEFQVWRFWRRGAETLQENWDKSPGEMKVIYKSDEATFHAMVTERQQRSYPFSDFMDWVSKNFLWATRSPITGSEYSTIRPSWLGYLVLFGLVMTCFAGRWRVMAIMLIPAVIHNVAVFSVGDCLPRYLLPVEWIGWILVAIGFDAVLEFVKSALGKSKEEAALAAPAQ